MTSENPFSKYKALVFDCYGTLIDWEAGIYSSLKPLFERNGKPSDKRTVIQAYSSVEHELEARYPTLRYTDILAKVYITLEARLQSKEMPPDALRDDKSVSEPVVASAHRAQGTEQAASVLVGTSADASDAAGPNPAQAFAHSVPTWQPFPDTVPALVTLSRHFKLIILSNIDRATIAKTRRLMEGEDPANLAFSFDAVYTAEDAGAYKPAPEMLDYALEHLKEDFGIEQDAVLMTAQSMTHDIIPAKGRGMDTAWINRPNAITGLGISGEAAKYVFPTLGDMAEAVEKASA
ncbi:HAD-like protein [Cubamyces menziesii]|uniref:Haloalkanoic acid dehalogenase n=1 Tax=Trametes cubensis TaxID=1111947 RepID=A0AAD7X8Z1_9APHY|nr:HAD-like protein [Cubamyces menziesii]KAJ8481626.1 hypothetical protein ONZ51_g5872 [Trametes cubensis]